MKREAYTSSGGVASEEPLASSIGASIMSRGGNAVDAAIAVSLALSVLVPHLGGVGGDYFALIRLPEGEAYFINGSGHSPARLTRSLLESKGYKEVPSRGPLSPTVPGMIDALYLMWRKFGSLEWRQLVEPAATLAAKGFPAPPSLVESIKKHREILAKDPGSKATYLEQSIEEPGDPVYFPGLARLLELVAEDPKEFYTGEPAQAIEEYLASRGGVLVAGDMRSYHALQGDPISLGYRGWRAIEMPPNTQGITTLHILALLEGEELPRNPLERLPALLRASLPAYLARDKYIGDPRFMAKKPGELLSREFIEYLKREAEKKTMTRARSREEGDTTFYAVVDSEGVVVAGIQSLFYPFGSGITEPKYQVTLNSRAQGFVLEEGHPNSLAPYKKPLHTLSALLLEDPRGERIVAIGTSGGHLRPQIHALIATSIVDHSMRIGEAIAAPRALWVPGTRTIIVDRGYEEKLKLEGYETTAGRTGVAAGIDLYLGRGTAILATDWRGDGLPAVCSLEYIS